MAVTDDSRPDPDPADAEAISHADQGPPLRERLATRVLRQLQASRLTWPVRLALLYAGIIVPVVSHAITMEDPPDAADWQSGALHDKLSFTLSGPASFAFYPLMLYPMVCLMLLLIRERRLATNPVVRFGILTGIPVAVWYVAMLGLVWTDTTRLLSLRALSVLIMTAVAVAVPLAVWAVLRLLLWARRKLKVPWAVVTGGLVVLYILCSVFVLLANNDPQTAAVWPVALMAAFFFFSLLFGPSWAFGVYLGMTLRLLTCYPRPLRYGMIQLMAVLSWLAAFLSACRWSVVKSLETYATLPTERPVDCYIASAAAYGHPRVVRSQARRMPDGSIVRVNDQLRVLKAAELAIRGLAPWVHRLLRRAYDRLGPLAACYLANPWLADLVYLLLKPVEWTSRCVLTCLLGRRRRLVHRLFGVRELPIDCQSCKK